MQKLIHYLVVALCFVAGFAGVALAQSIPEEPILDLARPVIDAILSGDYWLAASGALIVATTAAYRYLPRFRAFRWLDSTPGKAAAVFLVAYGGALSASLLGAATMSPTLAYGALKAALAAAGGYSTAKALIYPLLAWLETKAPGWMAPVLSVLLWVFRSGDPDAKADKAGDEAVAENPPGGVGAVVGDPTEVE